MTAEKKEVAPGQHEAAPDMVNKPPHYRKHPSGVECIQVTEHMNFNIGNAMKYLWRAGEKGNMIEDLKKARWYVDREVGRVAKSLGIIDYTCVSFVDQIEALKDCNSSLSKDNAWMKDQNTMLNGELASIRMERDRLAHDLAEANQKLSACVSAYNDLKKSYNKLKREKGGKK